MYYEVQSSMWNLQTRAPNIYALLYDEFFNVGKVEKWNKRNNRKRLTFSFRHGFKWKLGKMKPLNFELPELFEKEYKKIAGNQKSLKIFYNGSIVPIAILNLKRK